MSHWYSPLNMVDPIWRPLSIKWCKCKEKKYSVYVFEVSDYEFSVRFYEFTMAAPIWLPYCLALLVSLGFWVPDFESEVRISKFKMANPIWISCCYKISVKLIVVVPIKFIFTHAKKDEITEKNVEMKNSKQKMKLRRLYGYTPSQKFDTIRISVLWDVKKIFKKSTILKLSKTYFI